MATCPAEGVRRTLAIYCQLMDDGRYADAAALFVDDAQWTVQGVTHHGIDEIRALMSDWPVPTGGKHLTFNSVIDVDGDAAAAVSDYLMVRSTEIGGVVHRGGRYHDTLRRDRSGLWRFVARENRGSSFVQAGGSDTSA